MKAKRVVDSEGRFIGVRINCPGCGERHTLPVRPTPHGEVESPHYANHAHWHFNGDYERPTLSPSVNVKAGHYADGRSDPDSCWCTYYEQHPEESKDFACFICHFFLREGVVEYLGDCTHSMACQKVELPDIE